MRWEDILVVLAVGLILFGPNKIVDFAKSLGSAFTEFKKAANPETQQVHAVAAQPAMAHAAPARARVARKPAAKKASKAKKKRA